MISSGAYLRKIAKQDSYIGRYMQFMFPLETPLSYDFWTALWTLSTAIGRDCIVNRPRAPVYLNLYLFLLAESGITRKSTSVRYATSVVNSLQSSYLETSETSIFESVTGKTTPEQLLMKLAQRSSKHGNAHTAISVSEMVTLLGRESYTVAMPGLLTDLYDCPARHDIPGTLKHGALHLRDVYITLLSASTPSWLSGAINPSVVEGGFTSRVIIVSERHPKRRVPWPNDSQDEGKMDSLAEELGRIRQFAAKRGDIPLSTGARRRYDKWYKTRPMSADPYRDSFESREDDHVLRVAALLAASNGKWIIDQHDLVAALALVAAAKNAGASVFEGASSKDKIIYGIDKIREHLIKQGKQQTSQSELYALVRTSMRGEDIQFVMDIMHELGMVNKFTIPAKGGRGGKPKTTYVGTNKLMTRNAMELILNESRPE